MSKPCGNGCGKQMQLFQSQVSGKYYWACKKKNGGCGHFEWENPNQNVNPNVNQFNPKKRNWNGYFSPPAINESVMKMVNAEKPPTPFPCNHNDTDKIMPHGLEICSFPMPRANKEMLMKTNYNNADNYFREPKEEIQEQQEKKQKKEEITIPIPPPNSGEVQLSLLDQSQFKLEFQSIHDKLEEISNQLEEMENERKKDEEFVKNFISKKEKETAEVISEFNKTLKMFEKN